VSPRHAPAWPSASQIETQDSLTQSPHENTAGREEQHSILAMAYDEIIRDRQNMAITTRSAACGDLTSIYANSQV